MEAAFDIVAREANRYSPSRVWLATSSGRVPHPGEHKLRTDRRPAAVGRPPDLLDIQCYHRPHRGAAGHDHIGLRPLRPHSSPPRQHRHGREHGDYVRPLRRGLRRCPPNRRGVLPPWEACFELPRARGRGDGQRRRYIGPRPAVQVHKGLPSKRGANRERVGDRRRG